MKNQTQMEDMGFSPIPVYHMGSHLEALQEICNSYNYVCLGGTVGTKTNKRIEFFEFVFHHFPHHNFHGLGLTDLNITKLFPFYSVDSTTWLMAEKVNKIFTADGKRITPDSRMSVEKKFENTIGLFAKLDLHS